MYDSIIKAINFELAYCKGNETEVCYSEGWTSDMFQGYLAGLRQSLFIIAKETVLGEQGKDN